MGLPPPSTSSSSPLPPRYDQLSLRGQALTSQNAEVLHCEAKREKEREGGVVFLFGERKRRKRLFLFARPLTSSFFSKSQKKKKKTSPSSSPFPGIENLRRRRDAAEAALRADEAERASLQREAAALTRKLQELDERVSAAARARDECESVLATAEAAYEKILQSAQSLRDVLKAEAGGSEVAVGGNGRRRRGENGGNGSQERSSNSSDTG